MEETLKHEFVPFEVSEVHEERPMSPMPPMSPVPMGGYREFSPMPIGGYRETSPMPVYVPKQGKMTVDDVEKELEMLMQRMEFLEKTLQELKKENEKDL